MHIYKGKVTGIGFKNMVPAILVDLDGLNDINGLDSSKPPPSIYIYK
jgi:hypothetical protein